MARIAAVLGISPRSHYIMGNIATGFSLIASSSKFHASSRIHACISACVRPRILSLYRCGARNGLTEHYNSARHFSRFTLHRAYCACVNLNGRHPLVTDRSKQTRFSLYQPNTRYMIITPALLGHKLAPMWWRTCLVRKSHLTVKVRACTH